MGNGVFDLGSVGGGVGGVKVGADVKYWGVDVSMIKNVRSGKLEIPPLITFNHRRIFRLPMKAAF